MDERKTDTPFNFVIVWRAGRDFINPVILVFLCTSLWEFERLAMAVNSLTCALLKTNNNSFFLIIQEGACFLRGEERFTNRFEVDTQERKFSKDKLKAVTLIIQLCCRR